MDNIGKRYRNAVDEAKKLVKFRVELKYEIVKLALSVCIIKEGNSSSADLYTLTAFARDIGVAKGTLSKWKLEYENVISKVDIKDKQKINRYALDETMRKVNKNTSPIEVKKIYQTFEKGFDNPEDRTMVDYVRRLRSMRFFICYGSDISKINPGTLSEMKTYLREMLDTLEKGRPKNNKTKLIKEAVKQARSML